MLGYDCFLYMNITMGLVTDNAASKLLGLSTIQEESTAEKFLFTRIKNCWETLEESLKL